MRTSAVLLFALLGSVISQTAEILLDPKYHILSDRQILENATDPIQLDTFFNNRAFATAGTTANFDLVGGYFSSTKLPLPRFKYADVHYNLSALWLPGLDNVMPNDQTVPITTPGAYTTVHILAASHKEDSAGKIRLNYQDGTSEDIRIASQSWWRWPYLPSGDIIFPASTAGIATNFNQTNIFQSSHYVDYRRKLISVTLTKKFNDNLHIFAMSLAPWIVVPADKSVLRIDSARATETWPEGLKPNTRIIRVAVTNVGTTPIIRKQKARITIKVPGLGRVKGWGHIRRLMPGERTTVDVAMIVVNETETQKSVSAEVIVTGENVVGTKYSFQMNLLLREYTTDLSLYNHESPGWFKDAKFGVMFTWGLYSVPSWGNTGLAGTEAEWYWWNMQNPAAKAKTMEYHLQKYGANVNYDDFMANFTARTFNPTEWVNLVAATGAKYLIISAKHHDGYNLFDLPPTVTKRTSVAQAPRRDFVNELFNAAAQSQPTMKKGVYYSIPEWFNPDYAKYGFGDWPGGNATNAWTKQKLPYTGHVPVNDYIVDVVYPSMRTLASYKPDIMWCDGGGPNVTPQFATEWYNTAKVQNQQVAMNNRCGIPGDFDTPEFKWVTSTSKRKWERNMGVDPFSYGYNRATPDVYYQDATTIVRTLIDVVSKNGNLLLNIGPTAEGTIIETVRLHLTNVGQWLKEHGEAIYSTSPWFVTPEEDISSLRFTQAEDAFYIFHLASPPGTLTIKSPVPWISGDNVTVVGGRMHGAVVPSVKVGNDLALFISTEVAASDRYAWVFKITF